MRDFINHLPPSGESAFYRTQHEESWWWEPQFDFFAAILNVLQWSNWQRGGGKGEKPEVVKRPTEKVHVADGAIPESADDLRARRKRLKSIIEGTTGGN